LQIAIEQPMILQNYVCDSWKAFCSICQIAHISGVNNSLGREKKKRICYLQGNEKVKTWKNADYPMTSAHDLHVPLSVVAPMFAYAWAYLQFSFSQCGPEPVLATSPKL
jgi:hypothetical protein